MIRSVKQVAVNIRDVERARGFYRDRLGLSHLFDAPPGLSFFTCGGVRLMLTLPEKGEFDHPASILYFDVEDIRAAHRELSGRGVKFRDEPHLVARLEKSEVWMCFFEDGEGNVLALTSEPAVP